MRLIGFSGTKMSQHKDELRKFVNLLLAERVTRYLEVGARHGDTFHHIMTALPPGSVGLAVDLPDAHWGLPDSGPALRRCVSDLRSRGYDAHLIFGDSHSSAVQRQAREIGPFDAVLIDGDHRYEPAMQDWIDYSPMGRIVALHDIDGEGNTSARSGAAMEVPRVWREVRGGADVLRSKEIIGKRRGLGIGVLWMDCDGNR
jgi:hypothetical protein